MAYLTTRGAAERLGISADGVRWLEKRGRLMAIKVSSGHGHFQRLYLEESIERYRKEREHAALARAEPAEALAGEEDV